MRSLVALLVLVLSGCDFHPTGPMPPAVPCHGYAPDSTGTVRAHLCGHYRTAN